MREVDYLIVGAGFAGLVSAERLCRQHKKTCLVVEKRGHIGGNCYDRLDEHGVRIHAYGPHYFRTNSETVLQYLSQFTEWIPGNYRVLCKTEGKYWSFPVNLETFEQYLGRPSSTAEMEAWLEENRIPFDEVTNSEEAVLSRFGPQFYKLFFEGYTLKQWQRPPRDLAPSVCNRIPLRTNRDARYLSEKYQVLPKEGYTALFENLISSCGDKLEIRLNTDYREILPAVKFKHMIYTGPIDAYFDHCYGPLPYRSLRFSFEHLPAEALPGDPQTHTPPGFFQPAVQVNYPGTEPWTRIVEIKHITGQQVAGTTLAREFPEPYAHGKEPYYPILCPETHALYQQYKQKADQLDHVTFLGRLGTYTYLNMDQVVSMALSTVEKLIHGI